MKVVFLDIDGVVNTFCLNEKLEPKYYTALDRRVGNEQAVRWLTKLCLLTDAKIVISSTWRHDGLDVCRECLYNSGLDSRIEIIDATPTLFKDRGEEIDAWLKEYGLPLEVEAFAILDDDSDMEPYMDHLVKCDHRKGFQCEEYDQALNLLTT